ncbi:MAG: sigma-54 dependent transcriptional regulator [Candidatus Poribacteria bacterium]|nr:sigma-54 dependent transcriptional regulator [Candidatus Poribacteria bacterium]MDE0468643.1 sigma-54 dependent transcriptional regulator [Candidatus Poribacteria bacterium]
MSEKTATQMQNVTRDIIGESAQMQEVFRAVNLVAPTEATVLITGETGVGKEIIAQAIHDKSSRKNKPFKVINCGAFSPELIQSELFGHEEGAFTTAIRKHHGIFEQANGGTLFLDEVSEMSPEVQVKFLRVLEQQEFSPVGAEEIIEVDVRVVAATNRNLKTAVSRKRFREDLYYRLNLFRIQIPPLRNRRSDIAPLAHDFVAQLSKGYNKFVTDIAPEAIRYLQNINWYGNVRELRNVIETALIFAESEELKKEDIETAVENLNEPDEHPDTHAEEFRDSFSGEGDPSQEPNGDSHITPEDTRDRLWELIQTGTMSEITSYISLMRYEAEIPHYSKREIAERLQISVPTLDKYCALAEENT